MKKVFMFLLCSVSIFSVFCVEWKTELEEQFISDKSIQLGGYEYGNLYTREKSELKIKYNLEQFLPPGAAFYSSYYKDSELIESLNIFSDFRLSNDGFLYAKIANELISETPIREVPIIFGNEFSFALPVMAACFKIGTKEYEQSLKKYSYDNGKYIKKESYKIGHRFFNDIIRNVNSSSHLIEKSHGIEFDYSGICLDWFLLHNGEWPQDEINPYCFPWVENAADSGIGEWIEFDLSSPQTITYILNGFVDGNRMHLYKANSRMKEAEFTGWTESGKEIKQDVHFEDFVYFKTVQFSEPVTKFRITIKETYPGEKWQDTAISAVMFPTNRK